MTTRKRICYKVSIGSPIDVGDVKANNFYIRVEGVAPRRAAKFLVKAKSDGTTEDATHFSDNVLISLLGDNYRIPLVSIYLFPVTIERVQLRTLKRGDLFLLYDEVTENEVGIELGNELFLAIGDAYPIDDPPIGVDDGGRNAGVIAASDYTLLSFSIFPYLDNDVHPDVPKAVAEPEPSILVGKSKRKAVKRK